MLMQLAAGDIGQLTDIEPTPARFSGSPGLADVVRHVTGPPTFTRRELAAEPTARPPGPIPRDWRDG